jgi:hypothetical protein
LAVKQRGFASASRAIVRNAKSERNAGNRRRGKGADECCLYQTDRLTQFLSHHCSRRANC